MTGVQPTVRVTIGVLTFRRPDDLVSVLPLLLEQARAVRSPTRAVDVLVVDNDPDGSARPVVDRLDADDVRYVVEPTPGIAAARNRVLAEARGSDVVVFIDDDERPHPHWLDELLGAWRRTAAQGVAGAVVSQFSGELDPWVAAGDFFRRRRLPTDSAIAVAATNNLLLDMAFVRSTGLAFDERFGISGGSDTLFTRQLVAAGGRLVWCDEAVVTDLVPADRMTRGWVLRRAFRSGNSTVRVDIAMAAGGTARTRARVRAVAHGSIRLLAGAARWGLGVLLRSDRQAARGLRTACRGAGMAAAAAGVVYREYRRTPRRRAAAAR